MDWININSSLPPQGEIVETKISDRNGERNFQNLKLRRNLWFVEDGSTYVYYTPTHWRPKQK
jgi:hypothetical protein